MLRTIAFKRQTAMSWLLALSLLSVASILIPGQAQQPEPLNEKSAKKAAEPPMPLLVSKAESLLPNPTLLVSPLDEQVLTLAFSPDSKNLITAGARYQL